MTQWTIQDSKHLYNINRWGEGFFDINEQGHLMVCPNTGSAECVDLYKIINEISLKGFSLPVLLRFPDILHSRIERLNAAFHQAILTHGYQNNYTAVYPIKVNQQFTVVNEIIRNEKYRVGLEAGSKTELMAVIALSKPHCGLIICNGYKDREYIRIALIARNLGHRIFIVIEKSSELELVIDESFNLNIKPLLGIRTRLSTVGSSKWQNTGGQKSKFGLSSEQTLNAIRRLEDCNLLECMQLLHFHLGSQITNIEDVELGISECCSNYSEMLRLGAPIEYVDVGGGLSVDYEGTKSRNYFSMNYAVEDYAELIVEKLTRFTVQNQLRQPHIITESGRAMAAHHAVLITNVIDSEHSHEENTTLEDIAPLNEKSTPLQHLYGQLLENPNHAIEIYHQAKKQLTNAYKRFSDNTLSLDEKSACEKLYYLICHNIHDSLNPSSRAHRDILDELNEKLADKFFCNISIFQSLPDIWAIDQVFPIMPLHRLQVQPLRRARLHDITCDSDGRIDRYVDSDGVESSLPLHEFEAQSPYYLGVFLVGAYQEILGDMHNLFGDTNSINVVLKNGNYRLEQSRRGDSSDYILKHIHFDPQKLLATYKQQLKSADINKNQYVQYLEELESGLTGYTYLED